MLGLLYEFNHLIFKFDHAFLGFFDCIDVVGLLGILGA